MTAPDYTAMARELVPCNCDVAYTTRHMSAPDCPWCNFGEDIAAALRAAHEMGASEERERCAMIARERAEGAYRKRMAGSTSCCMEEREITARNIQYAIRDGAAPQPEPASSDEQTMREMAEQEAAEDERAKERHAEDRAARRYVREQPAPEPCAGCERSDGKHEPDCMALDYVVQPAPEPAEGLSEEQLHSGVAARSIAKQVQAERERDAALAEVERLQKLVNLRTSECDHLRAAYEHFTGKHKTQSDALARAVELLRESQYEENWQPDSHHEAVAKFLSEHGGGHE